MVTKILTANKLVDGRAVWYSKEGEWSENSDHALLASSQAEIEILENVKKIGLTNNIIIDANLIDVNQNNNNYSPIRLRERIRQNGPTISYGLISLNK